MHDVIRVPETSHLHPANTIKTNSNLNSEVGGIVSIENSTSGYVGDVQV
jgi:hypothetical protein